jgi:serralysin
MPLALRPEAYVPNTATISPTNDPYVNGVLSGVRWAVDTLTFSFPASGGVYGKNYGYGENSAQFGHFNNAQQQATREILDLYASVANVHFVEINENLNQHATLRFAESNAPTTAWAYYPTQGQLGGDVWLRHSLILYDSPVKGNYGYTTLIHEIGHALGLKHPHEAEGYFHAMPGDHDSVEYSVMSYRSYVGASRSAYTNSTWSFPQTLMMYDIAAIQTLYGANYQTNSGDTTYHWDTNSGEFFINGEGQGAPIGNRVFMTLWDGGGHDTYDFSNYGTNLNVDLQPGGWSTISAEQLATLGYQHYAHGNIANALLYHNNPASLIEDVIGGSCDDVIVGNIADNTLTGGGGDDVLDGGFGDDTALYSGAWSDYSWVQNADTTWTIVDHRGGAPDGTDILKNIQYLDFTDLVVALAQGDGSGDTGDTGPVAVDDFYATRSRTITVDVLANDLAPNDESLSTILVSGPARGNLSVDEDGHFVYTSPRHFKGKISFSYAASDGFSESEIATVQIKFGRHHRSPHKVAKGNELDDFGPRHPDSHVDHFERGHDAHAAIFYDQAPATLGFDESVFNSPLRDESHWLFG